MAKCPHCCSEISWFASVCPHCTRDIYGMLDSRNKVGSSEHTSSSFSSSVSSYFPTGPGDGKVDNWDNKFITVMVVWILAGIGCFTTLLIAFNASKEELKGLDGYEDPIVLGGVIVVLVIISAVVGFFISLIPLALMPDRVKKRKK
jgi:hypothetical protein